MPKLNTSVQVVYIVDLYTINNRKFKDYNVGDYTCKLNESLHAFKEFADEDIYEVCTNIALELIRKYKGTYKYIIELTIIYQPTRDYFGEYDDNMTYSYHIISQNKTKYWNKK